jgi:hypothetical protein
LFCLVRTLLSSSLNKTRLSPHKKQNKTNNAQRTHPLTDERVQRVRALLPEAYAILQKDCAAVTDVFGRSVLRGAGGW